MSNVVYISNIISKNAREQISKPDENGYWKIKVGSFNTPNSQGAIYPFEAVKNILSPGSKFWMRMQNGSLRGESGHPKMKPGETMRQFISRLWVIDEARVSHHIKGIELVGGETQTSPVDVYAFIKPSGEKGPYLKESLENPEENVAFSVRSITKDVVRNGTRYKMVVELYTWDWVNDPGIRKATQWNAVGLESAGMESMDEEVVSVYDIDGAISDLAKVSNESASGLQSLRDSVFGISNTIDAPAWAKI